MIFCVNGIVTTKYDLKIGSLYIYFHFIIGGVNDEYSSSKIYQPSPRNLMKDYGILKKYFQSINNFLLIILIILYTLHRRLTKTLGQ
jgi:hypothetical protein